MKKALRITVEGLGIVVALAFLYGAIRAVPGQDGGPAQIQGYPGPEVFVPAEVVPTSNPYPGRDAPIATLTRAPMPTPIYPELVVGPELVTSSAGRFKILAVSREYAGQGYLCALHPSPDGQRAALEWCDTDGFQRLYVLGNTERDGIEMEMNILNPPGPSNPQVSFYGWFPDSRRLLVAGPWCIFDLETRRCPGLIKTWKASNVAISSSGERAVFSTMAGDWIGMADFQGKLLLEATLPADVPQGSRPEFLSWSPDDRYVAFIRDRTIFQFNSYGPLWVVNAGDGQLHQLSPDDVHDSFPQWSPEGGQLLVVRRENMDDRQADFDLLRLRSNLWVVDVAHGEWRQLTRLEEAGVWSPAWSPDGHAVVFLSNQGGEVNAWMVDADGAHLHLVASGQEWMPRAIAVIR